MKIKVSEIFCSLQGEGVNMGKPSVFLRTALCNLKCSWCDTKYTWDWTSFDYYKEVQEVDIYDVYKQVLSYRNNHLVVTGGEPMLQQRQLEILLKLLKKKGYYIEVETNGTIIPTEKIEVLIDQWNVSPKLMSSNNPAELREISSCYNYFSRNPKSYFKYVISNYNDVDEIETTIEKYHLPINKVLVMPQATSKEELIDRSRWLFKIARDKGYHFTSRLQVVLWQNVRGK